MSYFAFALIILGGFAGAIYLIQHSHPVWAFLILVMAGATEMTHNTRKKYGKKSPNKKEGAE